MTSNEILDYIDKNNLSIRKLPEGYKVTISTMTPREIQKYKDNTLVLDEYTEILIYTIAEAYPKASPKTLERMQHEYYPDNKVYRMKVIKPYKYPGFYLCKRIEDTSSIVQWDLNKDNLASTLEESIMLYMNKGE